MSRKRERYGEIEIPFAVTIYYCYFYHEPPSNETHKKRNKYAHGMNLKTYTGILSVFFRLYVGSYLKVKGDQNIVNYRFNTM